MNAVLIDFRQRYALGVDARVIPAQAWLPLSRVQDLVDQANHAVENLAAELADERQRAREAGLDEGRRTALDQFGSSLVALQRARDQLGEQMRAQVAELAVGIVERIAPSLGAQRLIPELVAEAVHQLALEPNLVVRVHPDVADATRHRVAAPAVAGAPAIDVVATPELGEFDCLIEAEGGVVRAGLKEQLDQVRVILASARREPVQADTGLPFAENVGDAAE